MHFIYKMYQYSTQNNIFVASVLWFYKYFPNRQRLFRHVSSCVRGPLDEICSHLAHTPKRKISTTQKITTKGVTIYTVENVLHKKVAFFKMLYFLIKSHLETNQ